MSHATLDPTTPPVSAIDAPAGVASPPPPPPPKPERKLRPSRPADKRGWWWGTGRRKSAVARIRLKPAKDGEAKFVLRGKTDKLRTVEEYFAEPRDRNDCYAPLKVTNTLGKFEVRAQLHGGGFMGQAGAVKLGIARALRDYDPTLEAALREHGMLTRDAREVERKKYGQAGARRRFQFSKR